MNTPKLTNIGFEVFCAVVSWINVHTIIKDKAVKGVFWPACVIYMYPALHMQFAPIVAIGRVSAQITWVVCAVYLKRKGL